MPTRPCARCRRPKAANAFAWLVVDRDRDVAARRPARRDPVCRQCRGELARGVPDQIVQLRERELRLAARLRALRAEIRSLLSPPEEGAA